MPPASGFNSQWRFALRPRVCEPGIRTIARCHHNRLVARRFLDLFDGRSSHRKPRAESVPVGMPNESGDSCLPQTWMEPRPRVVAPTLTRENWIARSKICTSQRFNSRYRIRIEMNRSSRAVLCFGEFKGSAVEMNLRPGARLSRVMCRSKGLVFGAPPFMYPTGWCSLRCNMSYRFSAMLQIPDDVRNAIEFYRRASGTVIQA